MIYPDNRATFKQRRANVDATSGCRIYVDTTFFDVASMLLRRCLTKFKQHRINVDVTMHRFRNIVVSMLCIRRHVSYLKEEYQQ